MPTLTLSNLTFLFQITPIHIKPDAPENRKFNGYWYPPESSDALTIDQRNQTGWFIWTNSNASPNGHVSITPVSPSVGERREEEEEEVCSIFFDSECNYFLATPTDCTQTGSTGRGWDIGWTRLGFEHPYPTATQSQPQPNLSKLTFAAERHTLAGTGSRIWMPQLLPETYDNHETQVPTGLAGDLSLLVALAGFTSNPTREEFLNTMARHFHPPNWVPRGGGKPGISKWFFLPSFYPLPSRVSPRIS